MSGRRSRSKSTRTTTGRRHRSPPPAPTPRDRSRSPVSCTPNIAWIREELRSKGIVLPNSTSRKTLLTLYEQLKESAFNNSDRNSSAPDVSINGCAPDPIGGQSQPQDVQAQLISMQADLAQIRQNQQTTSTTTNPVAFTMDSSCPDDEVRCLHDNREIPILKRRPIDDLPEVDIIPPKIKSEIRAHKHIHLAVLFCGNGDKKKQKKKTIHRCLTTAVSKRLLNL